MYIVGGHEHTVQSVGAAQKVTLSQASYHDCLTNPATTVLPEATAETGLLYPEAAAQRAVHAA